MRLEKLFRWSLLSLSLSLCQAQQPGANPAAMTNADVIALATAGLGDEIVIAKINAAPTTAFDTSVDGLKALKAAGVSIEVVKTMISPMSSASLRAAVSAAAPPDPDDPNSPHPQGIYMMADDATGQSHMTRMREIDPTQVIRGGFLSVKFTAELPDEQAPLQVVDATPRFYAYAGADSASFEAAVKRLALVKLNSMKKTRQLVIGGLNAGLEDNVKQEMKVVEVRSGVLMMSPAKPLVPGEYALYEAGTWQRGAMAQQGGEYFDFGVEAKP
jgi:hypothetical protein